MNIYVIGGGAAGFFAALAAKKQAPSASVTILEKSSQLLSKVRISGGGRCNVTHACFDPLQLVQNYPRGSKALIGPFTRFQPRDTIAWFASRGVELKTEEDGRVFPTTDRSQTIIDCLLREAKELEVEILLKCPLLEIKKQEKGFDLILSSGDSLFADRVILATGSHPQGHQFAKALGHHILEPVPSLFTFNIPSSPLKDLAGISLPYVTVAIRGTSLIQGGPLLVTHWGFSGPAVLKLSAWGARLFHEKDYRLEVSINWIAMLTTEDARDLLFHCREVQPNQTLLVTNPLQLPKNLWRRFLLLSGIEETRRCSEISNKTFQELAVRLTSDRYLVEGKTTYKEEFVTCGGVSTDEVNFKTMESRACRGLFFCGEILDIDGVTGGFNFQNAWTTGWLAGNGAIVE